MAATRYGTTAAVSIVLILSTIVSASSGISTALASVNLGAYSPNSYESSAFLIRSSMVV